MNTYYVSTTLFVFSSDSFNPNILANPKSDIFGFISSSSKILLDFKSRWTILSLEYWSSWVMLSMILKRVFQFNMYFLVGSYSFYPKNNFLNKIKK